MDARPDSIVEFFNAERQLMVPLFQRPYEWTEKHWSVLWDDLLERYEQGSDSKNTPHFTGAIVTAPAKSVPVGVSKFLVIDGQQRLTTVSTILCALRSLFPPDSVPSKRITRLLINDLGEGSDKFKLLPTQLDRPAWRALLEEPEIAGNSQFHRAMEYYRKRLQELDSAGNPIDLDAMLEILRTKLHVVSITLAESDDPYLIFESLNAKGAQLTQADLIRNYVLLRLRTQEQEKLYNKYWVPMQKRLGDSLTEFMRVYLMRAGNDVVRGEIYSSLKRRMSSVPDDAVAAEIESIAYASEHYAKFLNPELESNRSIRARLTTLLRWEAATSHPLLLLCYGKYGANMISAEEFGDLLKVVESFVIRRAVCNVPTNQLKKIFLSLTKEVNGPGTSSAIAKNLSGGQAGRRWPTDDEFRKAWDTFQLYANLGRCRVVLESLENAHAHKEPASLQNSTVEHVMPQTLTPQWEAELGNNEASTIHARLLDTVGNLTLSAYNSELSNLAFAEKKKVYATSNYVLNQYFDGALKWDEQAILTRAAYLADTAVKIWPRSDA
jgi:hypothetical protein